MNKDPSPVEDDDDGDYGDDDDSYDNDDSHDSYLSIPFYPSAGWSSN